MQSLKTLVLIVAAAVAVAGTITLVGWRPTAVHTEVLKPTVRANPGSYRPIYSEFTGYQPVRTGTGGSGGGVVYVRGRSSGGGGYRGGK